MKGQLIETDTGEKAFLVGADLVRVDINAKSSGNSTLSERFGDDVSEEKTLWNINESLDELEQLAKTAGIRVLGRTTQRLKEFNPATYIGKGKVLEIQAAVAELGAHTVIFDDELSPSQQKNLENILGEDIKVIDRTALILDIFARHALSREGQIQVELAQYEYRLPRLTRMWTHLIRQAGGRSAGALGGVGLRGPGETQLESDRRVIQRRITLLKKELEEVRSSRQHHRTQRKRSGMNIIVIVGYTNAGKSSLLNRLCDTDVLAEDMLFATLDPTTRRVKLPGGRIVLFTDTVGFIKKLPTNIVAAFRATLEGILEADLILHVADISHHMAIAQAKITEKVLAEQGAGGKPMLLVWNKIDKADHNSLPPSDDPRNLLTVSAHTGEGIDRLLLSVENILNKQLNNVRLEIPYADNAVLHDIYSNGQVNYTEYTDTGTILQTLVPSFMMERIRQYIIR